MALIVGAGAMGMAVARRLAQRHRLLLADIDAAKAADMSAVLRTEGAHCEGIGCDVTDRQSVTTLAEAVSRGGGLGALAHVAALSPSSGDFEKIISVNLVGPALVSEAMLPHARPGSAAVLVSSLAAHTFHLDTAFADLFGDPVAPDLPERMRARAIERLGGSGASPGIAYTLSKKALLGLVRRKAQTWGERGARIVSLSPGMIATPMGALEFENSEGKRRMFERTPLKREGTMHEIADAVEFLLSDRASFISGTDLLVDGGLAAAVTSQ